MSVPYFKLSILICTIPERFDFFRRIYSIVEAQITSPDIQVLAMDDAVMTIGKKRNELLQAAKGEYVCFIDDDDRISNNYIQLLMEGINKGVDCCSLKGIITEDGQNPLIFEHSIKYGIWRTITDSQPWEVRYERPPNHLSCIRSSIAKQFRFPEKNHGEDHEWSNQIQRSGLIKTEHYIPEVIYYYDWRKK